MAQSIFNLWSNKVLINRTCISVLELKSKNTTRNVQSEISLRGE